MSRKGEERMQDCGQCSGVCVWFWSFNSCHFYNLLVQPLFVCWLAFHSISKPPHKYRDSPERLFSPNFHLSSYPLSSHLSVKRKKKKKTSPVIRLSTSIESDFSGVMQKVNQGYQQTFHPPKRFPVVRFLFVCGLFPFTPCNPSLPMVNWSHDSHQSPETFCTHYHLFGWIFLRFLFCF